MGLEMLDMSDLDEFEDSGECFAYPEKMIAWIKERPVRCKLVPWADLSDNTVQAVLKEIPKIRKYVAGVLYSAKLRESREHFSGRSGSRK